jgi:catecholate siderophore receptor
MPSRLVRAPLAAALASLLLAHAPATRAIDVDAPDAAKTDEGEDAAAREARDAKHIKKVEVVGERSPSVTSPKYTQPLVDTPQTLVIIPSAIYEAQAQTTLRDALRNTPGITIQAGEGGGAPGDNVYIRGFTARNDISIDGARDPGVVSRDLFNIEQVEVAKGPASAITGRGSTGGSINLASKMAGGGQFARVDATAGTDSYGRITADLGTDVGEDSAVRLNAMWQDMDVPGRDVAERSAWGIAPSFATGLGTDTRLFINAVHLEQDNIPDYGIPIVLPPSTPAGTTPADLDWSNFYGLAGRDYEKVDSTSGTIIVEHDFSPTMTLRNLTRFGVNDRDAIVTSPRAATLPSQGTGWLPGVPQIRRNDMKSQDREDSIFANQTSLSMQLETGAVHHDIVAGVELSREDQESYARVETSTTPPPFADLYDPDPDQLYPSSKIQRNGASTDAVGDSLAMFAFDTLKLNEQWQLSAGLRWERFDVDYTAVAAPVAPATQGLSSHFKRSDDMLSWRAGVVYKPSENGTLYFAAGTSFNPSADGGQGLVLGGSGVNSALLEPEESRTVELGTKWLFLGGKLSFNAALFESEKTNARATDPLGNTVLAGDQEIQGVELGLAGNITEHWQAFAGYAYMDSQVQESPNPLEQDRELAYVPRNTFNLWTSYAIGDITLGAGAQYTDTYFFTSTIPPATALALQPYTEYWLFNAMASWRVNETVSLQLNATNLTDEKYIERGYNAHFTPGQGRAILLGVHLDL